MSRIAEFLKQNKQTTVLTLVILVLTGIPAFNTYLALGDPWQKIPPTFTDETFYHARVQTIINGHPTQGNPYFLEHADGPPLVIFAGTWINAIPQLSGLSLNASLTFNFVLWSLLFAASLYWLFSTLRVNSWIAVIGTIFVYVQSYSHIWRPVNLQPVYPFYFLFYIALLRLIREQSKKNVILLAVATGASFYLLAYLWQIAVITLGLLFLYACFTKKWSLGKATLLASFIGGFLGLPVPLYALWLSHSSPYFWESVGRLGLVNTHLPMAEIVYSGGWIILLLALLAILYWKSRNLREDKEFINLSLFITISGLGLWIMQGSNLFTGKLLETGEHIKTLLQPWLIFSTLCIGTLLWTRRWRLSNQLIIISSVILGVLILVSANFASHRFYSFIPARDGHDPWITAQLYAQPFDWLQEREINPVVVWSEPINDITTYLPIITKHFVLYAWAGMMELLSDDEVQERYLVSQYFNNPTLEQLKDPDNMRVYLGRHDMPHAAKTEERKIKICRIIFFWDSNKDCGTPQTPAEYLGDAFFVDLENKFQNDIKPNIKAYLKKYHFSYILKDKILNPSYHPEVLGAKRVYADDRFELWQL